MDRTLIVAPSWVGDAILAEPLLAMLREPYEDPSIDVLAPPWCSPVFRRMRGVRRIVEIPIPHGKLDLRTRRRIAAELRRDRCVRMRLEGTGEEESGDGEEVLGEEHGERIELDMWGNVQDREVSESRERRGGCTRESGYASRL